MPAKEATARIKINKLLENAGWRFFADAHGPANIQLEAKVKITTQDLDALGERTLGFAQLGQLALMGLPERGLARLGIRHGLPLLNQALTQCFVFKVCRGYADTKIH